MTNSSNRKSSEEQKPKVNGINDVAHSFNLRPCSSSRRIRIRTPFLPKEIIFKILLCLPAEILYNVMRFVCWEWYGIIKDPMFIDAHLQRSSEGVLIQISLDGYYTQYAELGKDGVEITDLSLPQGGVREGRDFCWLKPPNSGWGIPLLISCPFKLALAHSFPAGEICGSCNGLVMIVDFNCYGVHVANLILKQKISLPPANLDVSFCGKIGFAYATTSRKYKVVHANYNRRRYAFEIFTVGVDKTWRYLGNVDELSCMRSEVDIERFFSSKPPLTTAGFLHWVTYPYVLSLDVEKEIFHFNVAPCGHWNKVKRRFSTESYLSFMISSEELTWEQWALTEVEKGTWLKLRTINLCAQKHMFQSSLLSPEIQLFPVCLHKNGELVCFLCYGKESMCRKYIFYNVKTGTIHFFNIGGIRLLHIFYHRHVTSLVSVGDDSRGPA